MLLLLFVVVASKNICSFITIATLIKTRRGKKLEARARKNERNQERDGAM